MRLATVLTSAGPAAAAATAAGWALPHDDSGRPYADVGDLLVRAPDWRDRASRATETLPAATPLLRPVLRPGAIVCVGMNYRRHVVEMGREMPTAPTLFTKLARSLTDPGADVELPAASRAVDYEGELVVVIGDGGRDIPPERAWDAVAGLTLMNDVSMRDWQRRSLQWFAGKAWEACTPVGPGVVTPDELPDLGRREIVTRVNGEERQRAPFADVVFDVPTLVSDLSRIFTLHPGDLIATGTPGGVGDARKPPRYLEDGDVVEVEFEGIGVLRNRFARR
jgi:acylpyruvate hydrolase